MGRFLRFFLVLNMWLGFNYGIIVNLYRALPIFDRPLFIFIYVMLVVIPPCLFYTYLTFIFEKNYVHSYELKKFIKKCTEDLLGFVRELITSVKNPALRLKKDFCNFNPHFNIREADGSENI